MIFSCAEDVFGKMVYIDEVPNGLDCRCICPCCHERLQARHGKIRAHGFAHHSDYRGANLKICYMVSLYKLAEQLIQCKKQIRVPSYYGIFKGGDLVFSEVALDSQYDREDKQPDVIAITPQGERFLIEFTFDYKVQRKKDVDYKNLNCIEINLSSQKFETLDNFIFNSDKDRRWINHNTYFNQIENVYLDHGKKVQIVPEEECNKCYFNSVCCGIRLKDSLMPIVIENNGTKYRVCKVEELEKKRRQKSNWDYYRNERQWLYGKG